MSSSPIGVFDSGIGGLSVLNALTALLPHEDFLYFADTARTPYGNKTPQQLLSYCQQIVDWMAVEKGVKMVVVACHTSSVIALPMMPHPFSIPIVGMLLPMASLLEKANNVGLIATQASVNSGAHAHFFRQQGFSGMFHSIPCPMIVPLLEAGDEQGLEDVIKEYVQPFWTHPLDTLIYGCTHYPFAQKTIVKHLPQHVVCLDPAGSVVVAVRETLVKKGLLSTKTAPGVTTFYCNSAPDVFAGKVSRFTGREHPHSVFEAVLDDTYVQRMTSFG